MPRRVSRGAHLQKYDLAMDYFKRVQRPCLSRGTLLMDNVRVAARASERERERDGRVTVEARSLILRDA